MPAKSKKIVKVSQEDLRKLMKQKTQAKKVESSYAKYNNLDQLTCTACGKVIKSNQLWDAHVLSKQHKDMVDKLQTQGPLFKPLKSELPLKKPKLDTAAVPSEPKVIKSILKNSSTKPQASTVNQATHETPPKYSHKEETEDEIKDGGKEEQKIEEKRKEKSQNGDQKQKIAVSDTSIPEGFFDDPKLDAKARNVKYVDKIEEEMEQFQKEIKQAEMENQMIVEEEDEATSEQKTLDQLDEELNLWSKPYSLAKKKDEKLQEIIDRKDIKQENSDDEGDVDLSSLLDWRSKVPFKK